MNKLKLALAVISGSIHPHKLNRDELELLGFTGLKNLIESPIRTVVAKKRCEEIVYECIMLALNGYYVKETEEGAEYIFTMEHIRGIK
tara:strand:- start:1797 stop:2060 length:264 start_codon:yes stop_codon:yes gene_type:complete